MKGRTFALLGSGEFEPWSDQVDRWILDRDGAGGGRVLILPTASAKEGDDVFDMWAAKGLEHYARQGIPAELVPLKTREDALSEAFVSLLDGASMVFFSGGNPAYLASVLLETPFWAELLGALERGLAYAGCSAGIACLSDVAPDSDAQDLTQDVWMPGLGLFPGVRLMPHWDALDTYQPGLTELVVASVPSGVPLVAIDEKTAIVGDGKVWSVLGSSRASVFTDGSWEVHPSGTSFELPM